MDFELISSEAFDSLPEDDEQCFVEFESICRASVNRILDDEKSGDLFVLVRTQYMAAVYAVAQECGLTNVPSPQATDDFRETTRFSAGFRQPFWVRLPGFVSVAVAGAVPCQSSSLTTRAPRFSITCRGFGKRLMLRGCHPHG